MSDFIVTNPNESSQDTKAQEYSQFLEKQDYNVLETSVHGKNQTRFMHFILEKDGKKYFCKANKNDMLMTHMNAALVRKVKNVPEGVEFLTPIDELEYEDTVFHVFPYINQRPVSNEAEYFRDFNVSEEDLEVFFGRVLMAINCIESQKIVTINEANRHVSAKKTVLDTLKRLPGDTPYAVEFLQYLLQEDDLDEYRTALDDIQPQNMFWLADDKKLIVFDLDFVGVHRRYFDHAKFFAQLWIVYDRAEYAKQFMKLVFASIPEEKRGKAYRYIRFNLTHEALRSYWVFKDAESQTRTQALMRWIRKDLLEYANQ